MWSCEALYPDGVGASAAASGWRRRLQDLFGHGETGSRPTGEQWNAGKIEFTPAVM